MFFVLCRVIKLPNDLIVFLIAASTSSSGGGSSKNEKQDISGNMLDSFDSKEFIDKKLTLFFY